MILANHGIVSSSGGVLYDADALSFITAAAITDNTQKTAVNTLVTDLKTYNIWSKMKAIYPFVGGSATSHKWNLKDPRDLDAAFRLVFNGGWTHSATGVKPNGTTAYAETKLVPNNVLIARNTHMGLYSRENTIAENYRIDMGACNLNTAIPIMSLSAKYDSSSNALSDSYNLNTNRILISNSDSKGFYLSTRTSINSHKVFKDTTILATDSVNDGTNSTPEFQITIGGFNFAGSVVQYSNREQAFASIGDGLSDTEASNLYTAVQLFNTTLSRQV